MAIGSGVFAAGVGETGLPEMDPGRVVGAFDPLADLAGTGAVDLLGVAGFAVVGFAGFAVLAGFTGLAGFAVRLAVGLDSTGFAGAGLADGLVPTTERFVDGLPTDFCEGFCVGCWLVEPSGLPPE